MVLTDPVLDVIRRELRRVSPDVRIESEQIRAVLAAEVIKRDVLEGEKADEARKKIARAVGKALRAVAAKEKDAVTEPVMLVPAVPESPEATSEVVPPAAAEPSAT